MTQHGKSRRTAADAVRRQARGAPRRAALALLLLLAAALPGCTSRPRGVAIDPTPWIDDLNTDDLFVIEPAAAKLVALGDPVVPALAAGYDAGEAQQRLNILEVLRDIGTPSAAAALARGVDDRDDEVRDEALNGLAALAMPETGPAVERAIAAQAERPSRAVVQACIQLCRSAAALDRLVHNAIHGAPINRNLLPVDGMRELRGDAQRAPIVDAAIDREARPLLGAGTPLETRTRAALLVADRDLAAVLPILLDYADQGDSALLRFNAMLAASASDDPQVSSRLARLSRTGDPDRAILACHVLAAMQQRGAALPPGGLSGCGAPGRSAPGPSASQPATPGRQAP